MSDDVVINMADYQSDDEAVVAAMADPETGKAFDDLMASSVPTEWPSPADPMAVARKLIELWINGDALTLRYWRGGWMEWQASGQWVEIEHKAVSTTAYESLENAYYMNASTSEPWRPSRRKIGDVLDALGAITFLPESIDTPSWIEIDGPPPDEMVVCRNGLLHVTSRDLLDHNPRFFTRVSVPFDYQADAPEPTRWLEFLHQLWPDDSDSIAALQQFFGYVISGRTDLHKILLMIGPTRAGKGVIARVLTAMIGKGNVAGPTLASLAQNFGMAPLLGKPLAIVSDARLGAGRDTNTVVERLLSISGEDFLTVDRKYRDQWTGKLPTRLFVISNELPNFGDASGAVANRFIVLELRESWLGRENTQLTDELLTELPGILNWSLDGLDQLNKQGQFTRPQSSEDAILALQDIVSPVAAFVRDHCERGPFEVPIRDLFEHWRTWCSDNGVKPGSQQSFGRDLRAVIPGLRRARPRIGVGGTQVPYYVGLRLKGSDDDAVSEDDDL